MNGLIAWWARNSVAANLIANPGFMAGCFSTGSRRTDRCTNRRIRQRPGCDGVGPVVLW
jgi:hypothetical protein